MIDDDDLKFWIVIGSVFIAIFFFAWAVIVVDCKTYSSATGREVKLEMGTCYVKTEKGWFSKEQIRGIE